MKTSGHKLIEEKFTLDMRKNFSVRVSRIRNTLPAEVVQSPCLEVIKRRLGKHLFELV